MRDEVVVIADLDGVIRFWSPGAEAAFGYAPADAIGRTLDLIVPPEFREAHWTGFRRAVQTGVAAAEGEIGGFPVRRADGAIQPTPGRLTLIRDLQEQVIAAMVVFLRPETGTPA